MSQLAKARLDTLADDVTVAHVGPTTAYFTDRGVPFFRTGNVGDRELILEGLKQITPEFHQKLRKSTLKSGDIMVSRVVSDRITCAIVPPEFDGANCGNVIVIRPGKNIVSKYLSYLISAPESQRKLLQRQVGSAQAVVNTSVLKAWEIPLPPIAEQKRIAAILDKAEELRGLRRKALEQLDAIAQSIFLEMFGDPVINPKGWERKFIKEIGQVITGNTPPRAQPELYGNAIEWIKSDNINTPHNYLTKANEGLSEVGKAIARTVPPSSILVTCIAGTPDCIGNAAIADREVAFNQQINALVPQIGDFRFFYTQILVNKRLIQEASTSSMKGMVSKSRFEEIQLIFPPANMQQAFGESFDTIEQLKTAHQESLAQLDALFASLQHRAFRGEL